MAYKEIKSLPISDFTNANHLAYVLQALTIISGQTEIAEEFAKYLDPLREAYEKEDEVMEKIPFSEYTKNIADADDERDKHLEAFNRVWRAYLDFPNETKAAAAARIEQYWRVHKVNSSAQYDRESGQMINFIQDMRTYCAEAIEELGLTTILNEMEHWNDEVNRLLLVRNEEYVDNKHIAVVTARKKTDECYLRLVKAINAKAFLAEGTEDATRYDRVIDLMNQNIERILLEVFKKKGQAGVNGGATGAETLPPTDGEQGTGGGGTGGSTGGEGTGREQGSETTEPTFTVTYIKGQYTWMTQQYAAGDRIVPPAEPEAFRWVDVPEFMPDHDITIYAQYVG